MMDAVLTKPIKPLGGKAYGSINHLPCSRMGPGDHHCDPGQQRICTEKPRKGDRIIVTEKLDGACMSVANIDGDLVALIRAGYLAKDAFYPHLKIFDDYVASRRFTFLSLLSPGERLVGEWLAMAHGTIYDPKSPLFSPFVAFDIFREGKRVVYDEFRSRVGALGLACAACLYDGAAAVPVVNALARLHLSGEHGRHGATEEVEGAVWRVEREGRVDFLAKFVRPDKVDGKYLPNVSGGEPIWHWRPDYHAEGASS